MSTRTAAFIWFGIGLQLLGFELFGWLTNHRLTLSQTLQRAFAHQPFLTLLAFGAFAAWFTLHIWGSLFNKAKRKVQRKH